MKILYSSLYPSIILENNLAPNTQIGKIIIEDDDPDKPISLLEHPDMYSSDDETAKYSRGGEFLENMMSGNPLEFCRRWMMLGDIYQVIDDIEEYYNFNKYNGRPINYDYKDSIYFVKNHTIEAVSFNDDYMVPPTVAFNNTLDDTIKKELMYDIKKGAIL